VTLLRPEFRCACGAQKSKKSRTCAACFRASQFQGSCVQCPRCRKRKKSDAKLCLACRRLQAGPSIPVARFRPIVEDWISRQASLEVALELLMAASGKTSRSWRRNLSAVGNRDSRDYGWWGREYLTVAQVDQFLAAADLVHLWYTELADLYEFEGAAA
jgi:hypothetical protein